MFSILAASPLPGGIGKPIKERTLFILGVVVLAFGLASCFPSEKEGVCEDIFPHTCAETIPIPHPGAIQQASAFSRGNRLYAKAELDPAYLNKLIGLLHHGEPIVATYRFRLYRLHAWLPSLRLSHVTLKRRVRLRLITRSYEMLDLQTGQIQYTHDPEEAMEFLGTPNYVFLGAGETPLSPDYRYRLYVDLTMEHEGMLHVFRVLDHWATLGQSGGFTFQADFQP